MKKLYWKRQKIEINHNRLIPQFNCFTKGWNRIPNSLIFHSTLSRLRFKRVAEKDTWSVLEYIYRESDTLVLAVACGFHSQTVGCQNARASEMRGWRWWRGEVGVLVIFIGNVYWEKKKYTIWKYNIHRGKKLTSVYMREISFFLYPSVFFFTVLVVYSGRRHIVFPLNYFVL